MKRLILLRHAKTEPWYEGVDDQARALTGRGHADSLSVARELQRIGWAPDHVMVSTARRARETWQEMQAVFPDAASEAVERLYLAGIDAIERELSDRPAQGTVLVIGHNPGLQDFACHVARASGSAFGEAARLLFERFPTACAALFEGGDEGAFEPARFILSDVIRAKSLREAGDEDDD